MLAKFKHTLGRIVETLPITALGQPCAQEQAMLRVESRLSRETNGGGTKPKLKWHPHTEDPNGSLPSFPETQELLPNRKVETVLCVVFAFSPGSLTTVVAQSKGTLLSPASVGFAFSPFYHSWDQGKLIE